MCPALKEINFLHSYGYIYQNLFYLPNFIIVYTNRKSRKSAYITANTENCVPASSGGGPVHARVPIHAHP